jgi:hypothetical protein
MILNVTTEVWQTRKGAVAKAVVRDTKGRIVGATNQTKGVQASKVIRPRVTVVGR